eukprot:9158967-Alexandrium_andersonii.AAC.1
MSASLVGSEMCIRDSLRGGPHAPRADGVRRAVGAFWGALASPAAPSAVSYTHLTLPTICSV